MAGNKKLAINVISSIVQAANFKGALKANLSREEDPTGQAKNRANLNKKIKARLANAQNEVIALFKKIPRQSKVEKNLSLNSDTFTVYDYDLPPEQQEQLESNIEEILLLWLLAGSYANKPFGFYSDVNVDEAYRTGTLEIFRDLNQDLSAISLAGLLGAMPKSVEPNLLSAEYINAVTGYQSDLFYQLKGMSDKASAQVFDRIISGVKAGESPRNIVKEIKKRFSVAESDAKRIVNTEINKYYTNSTMDAIDNIRAMGINAVGQHKSALLRTTREHHAARHDKYYTPAQQRRWWNAGANRINCYCGFNIVILGKDKKPILNND